MMISLHLWCKIIAFFAINSLWIVQGWKPFPSPSTSTSTSTAVKRVMKGAVAAVAIAGFELSSPASIFASSRVVAEIPTSGFVFKDKLKIEAFADPGLPGVTLFLGDFEKPLAEKIGGDLFDDPTSSTLSCAQTGPITESELGSLSSSGDGEEIFSESKNLFLKSVKVRRVKDTKSGALLYTSFSSKGDKTNDKNRSRFTASLCTVMPRL